MYLLTEEFWMQTIIAAGITATATIIGSFLSHFSKLNKLSSGHVNLSKEHKDLSKENNDLSKEHHSIIENQKEMQKNVSRVIEFHVAQQKDLEYLGKNMPEAKILKDGLDKILSNEIFLMERISKLEIENQQLKEELRNKNKELNRMQKNRYRDDELER